MAASSKNVDWEALEIQYRAGIRSLQNIGDEFGVSDTAIMKRAKRDGWVRDLKARIQAKAEAKVGEALVGAKVGTQTKIRENEVVEANATAVAQIRLEHRTDIRRNRKLFQDLMSELESQVAEPVLYEQLGEIMASPDEKGRDKLSEIYNKVISMPGRVDSAKKLTEVLEKVVKMEREAFGLNAPAADTGADGTPSGKPMTDVERAVRLMHFMQQGGK